MMFWTSLVVTAGSATGLTVFGLKVRGDDENAKEAAIRAWQDDTGMQLDIDDACGDASRLLGGSPAAPDLLRTVDDKCSKGERDALITNVFIGTTAVAAAATVFFYYKGYIASKPSRESANKTMSKRKKKSGPTVTFYPEVSPIQVSAGMRISF